MAQFTRVNGDFKQVLWLDAPAYTNTGVNAITTAVTVQPQGPKLDFFTLTGNGSQIADNIAVVFQTVEQLATIHLYEYTNATDDTLAIAVYPAGGWTTATLDAAFASAWTSANVSAATGASFSG
jgi:hypothetical protein